MAEHEGQGHDSRRDGELGRLKPEASNAQRVLVPVEFLTLEDDQDEKPQPDKIHRNRPPLDPLVINKACPEEDDQSNRDPLDLLVPGARQGEFLPHVRRRPDRVDSEDEQPDMVITSTQFMPRNFRNSGVMDRRTGVPGLERALSSKVGRGVQQPAGVFMARILVNLGGGARIRRSSPVHDERHDR